MKNKNSFLEYLKFNQTTDLNDLLMELKGLPSSIDLSKHKPKNGRWLTPFHQPISNIKPHPKDESLTLITWKNHKLIQKYDGIFEKRNQDNRSISGEFSQVYIYGSSIDDLINHPQNRFNVKIGDVVFYQEKKEQNDTDETDGTDKKDNVLKIPATILDLKLYKGILYAKVLWTRKGSEKKTQDWISDVEKLVPESPKEESGVTKKLKNQPSQEKLPTVTNIDGEAEIVEIIDKDTIAIRKQIPKEATGGNGYLQIQTKNYMYAFNIKGEKKPCVDPCYLVTISRQYTSGWSVSFSRNRSYADNYEGLGPDVFAGVLKALGEFVKYKKPKPTELHWSPISKTQAIKKEIVKIFPSENEETVITAPSHGLGYKDGEKIRIFGSNSEPSIDGSWTVIRRIDSDNFIINASQIKNSGDRGTISYDPKNTEARRSVYDQWSSRFLFPSYIGFDTTWMNREEYEDLRKRDPSYPPVPEDISMDSSPAKKSKALKSMRQEFEDNKRKKIEDQMRQERERREEERQHRLRRLEELGNRAEELIERALADETKNPQRVQKDDLVYSLNWNPESQITGNYIQKITEILINGQSLEEIRNGQAYTLSIGDLTDSSPVEARVISQAEPFGSDTRFDTRTAERVSLQSLEKLSNNPNIMRERKQKKLRYLLDPSRGNNPNGVEKGDEVIVFGESWISLRRFYGAIGTIIDFRIRGSNILAEIDYSGENDNFNDILEAVFLPLRYLFKATPEKVREIKSEINQQTQAQREQEFQSSTRRARRSLERRTRPVLQTNQDDLTNHPNNPLGLKVGDPVNWRGYVGEPPSVIIYMDIFRNDLRTRIQSKRNMGGDQIFTLYSLDGVTRDESEEGIQYANRFRRRAQRADILTTGTGGHNIGDTVTVITGRNRGKTGRIINFRVSGNNPVAVIRQDDGSQFTSIIRSLQPPASTPEPTAESFSFKGFLNYQESRINRF